MNWWDKFNGRLEQELDLLREAGMQPELIEENKKNGKICIKLKLNIFDVEKDAELHFPDLYPYFRPVLIIPNLGSSLRHYNPVGGVVCLLPRSSAEWYTNMTAAEHIEEMLPKWQQVAQRNYKEERLDVEDTQAEPYSFYLPRGPRPDQFVFIDSKLHAPPDQQAGELEIGIRKGESISVSSAFSAWILSLNTEKTSDVIKAWFDQTKGVVIKSKWSRLPTPPRGKNINEVLSFLSENHPEIVKSISRIKDGLYGLAFPEEAPDGSVKDGWIFLAIKTKKPVKKTGNRRKSKPDRPQLWLVKTEVAGEQDIFERIPELFPLRDKTVAVVGLGCVGAPSVLALARAGVGKIKLLDSDVVSPGTTCRWPLGLKSAGKSKAEQLRKFIEENYPFTKIGTFQTPIGETTDFLMQIGGGSPGYNQMDVINNFLEGADLVYDATAEEAINHLFSDLTRELDIPYVTVSSRPGGWGGNVVRLLPGGQTGCYLCYLHALTDKSIPPPPFDPDGHNLQPTGCADLTFKAASFDVEEISLAGVRAVVATLCNNRESAYPELVNDVGILTLRKEGKSVFPEWKSYQLPQHPQCDCNKQ